ncbi:MAG: hypothetical protein KAR84_02790 [Elusimicrobiales bacterium]|nr:hypothetical protein [Elusimicrobiales bacterium]MCK5106731.1 hypothetical protein [Elusimicrobiales bacterium]
MKFATCLNCMDGRVQEPVIFWIKNNHKVDFVDMITEAGMDGYLSDSNSDISRIKKKVNVSLSREGNINAIFVVGHYDCLGNPVDEKTHKEQINIAVKKVKAWKPEADVFGLWISSEWRVEKIV